MRLFAVVGISVLLFACGGDESSALPVALNTEATETVGSFTMRNGTRREMFLEEAEKRQIDVWINEDGSIGFHTADDEAINDIYDWIRAVIWVNN